MATKPMNGTAPATARAVEWYARSELAGPWRIAACEVHGRTLAAHRFERAGAVVRGAGQTPRAAAECSVCERPELLREVERCTCEYDAARCPEHQNLGCGC